MQHDSTEAAGAGPMIDPDKIRELDVRPILKAGGEPFAQIMEAIQSVPEDGALRLRATFKPTPLFHVLGKQGWSNKIEFGEGDDWVVLFYKETSNQVSQSHSLTGAAESLQKDIPDLKTRLKSDSNRWHLDVRALPPPEPMELTLAVLDHLPSGASLIQINERVPHLLLPILEERGFTYKILPAIGTSAEVHLEIGPAI